MTEPHCELCVVVEPSGVSGSMATGVDHSLASYGPMPPLTTGQVSAPSAPHLSWFEWLLDTTPFPARWVCGHWDAWLGWLHIVSDIAIWFAYMAIPAALLVLVIRRRDLPFGFLLIMFAAFILSCGTTHLIEASIFWSPVYRLSGFAKAGTAIISLATVCLLLPALPKVMALPGRARLVEELEAEIVRRKGVEAELRESQQRLDLVLEAANLGWWDYNPIDDTAKRSPHWYKMLGYEPDEVAVNRRAVKDFLHPEDVDNALMNLSDAMDSTDGWYSAQFRMRHAKGHYTWISSQGRVVSRQADGKALRLLGVYIDIDRMHKAEQSLLERTQELESMVHAVSHDIQSPLVTVQGFLKFVREALEEGRYADALEDLERVEAGAVKLKQMVGGILDVSNAGRIGEVHRVNDPSKVFHKVLEQLAPIIQEKQAHIEIDPKLPPVFADPIGLQRVLHHVMGNALRYGCPQTGMTIRVHGAQTSADTFLSISDDGPGIAPERHKQVFRMFERTPVDSKGKGIGLAAVAKVMASHNGRVWIESDGVKGTTFCLAFPKPFEETNEPPTATR